MHVFIDFSLLNLSFLSCHGIVGAAIRRGFFSAFKQIGQTEECERSTIINAESLPVSS